MGGESGVTRSFDRSLGLCRDSRETYAQLGYTLENSRDINMRVRHGVFESTPDRERNEEEVLAVATGHVSPSTHLLALLGTITHPMALFSTIDTRHNRRDAGEF
jgi:hypothetical protein